MVPEVQRMRVTLSKTKNAEHVYISKAYRNEQGKSTSRIMKKLGTIESLLPKHDYDREKVLAWAKEQARIMTEAEEKEELQVCLNLSQNRQLTLDEVNCFDGGYLFLQKLFHEIGLHKICDKVSKHYKFDYSLADVLAGLVYARILSPSSKLSSYAYLQNLLEAPSFSLHDIYRSLDVLHNESSAIQSLLYQKNSSSRNTSVLYYDCTNFFFETEDASGLRQYGLSKEHRPNPIVQMGLFLDGDGIPLAFTVFAGNENEQPTLIPLEQRILNDFKLSKFIVCTDAGLASYANRKFNNHSRRSYVVTQPLKTLKEHLKEWALEPSGFRLGSDEKEYNVAEIDEQLHRNSIFHKERWINENGLEQRLIVTYSVKRKYYEQEIRSRQVNRAEKIIEKGKHAKRRNHNSPERFIDEMQLTMDGEIAEKTALSLNTDKIVEEARFDGFYAVCTTLEDSPETIVTINKQRWEIEESFRIMKSDFKARPVYVQTDAHIEAHFLTCFIALTIFRLLEKKLGYKYTMDEIIHTLQNMRFQRIHGIGYMPCYTRTEITDALHEAFGFRTDMQIITDKKIKKIFKDTRK